MKTLVIIMFVAMTARGQEYVTISTHGGSPAKPTDEFRLETGQTAELVGIFGFGTFRFARDADSHTFSTAFVNDRNRVNDYRPLESPFAITGPATIQLTPWQSAASDAMLTFRIIPQAADPTRTAIVLPGTNGASITLECSTNLTDWASATNGVYTDLRAAKFFRIKVDRMQQ